MASTASLRNFAGITSETWVILVDGVEGRIVFLRPGMATTAQCYRSPHGPQTAARLAHALDAGATQKMMRSKTAHDAVADSIPQYFGVHYYQVIVLARAVWGGCCVPFERRARRAGL